MQVLSIYIQHGKTSLDRPFSYLYDGEKKALPGCRVLVDFHHQKIMGYIVDTIETSQTQEELSEQYGYNLSFIVSLIDEEPLLNDELTTLSKEVSEYYLAPIVSVLQTMLPASLKPSVSALRGPKIAYDTYVELVDANEEGLTDKQKESLRLIAANSPLLKKEAGSVTILENLAKKGKIRFFKQEKQRFVYEWLQMEKQHSNC